MAAALWIPVGAALNSPTGRLPVGLFGVLPRVVGVLPV
jgi:hypothetical protein